MRVIGPGRDLTPSRPEDASGPVPIDRSPHATRGDRGEPPGSGREEHYHPPPVERPATIEDPLDVEGPHLMRDALRR